MMKNCGRDVKIKTVKAQVLLLPSYVISYKHTFIFQCPVHVPDFKGI